jgi:pentose-5-phosphate-3-epimerase
MKVLPAPLEPTLEKFSAQFLRLLPYFKRFSIDIQDGAAVQTKTVTIPEIISFFKENSTLPTDVLLDFDLMVTDYEAALDNLVELKQYVSIGNVVILKSVLRNNQIPFRDGISIGLSLNIQDEIKDLAFYGNLADIPCIQIMTINAGPQGQPFIPQELNKIDQLRLLGYRNSIYIDGAVNKDTLPAIILHPNRPDYLCVGSYLTKSGDDLEERVNYLKSIER